MSKQKQAERRDNAKTRDKAKLNIGIQLMECMSQAKWVKVKECREARDCYTDKGFTVIHNLPNAHYSKNRKFYAMNLDCHDIIERFNSKGFIREDEKLTTIFTLDGNDLQDITFKELMNTKMHDDLGIFTIVRRNSDGESTFMTISFK